MKLTGFAPPLHRRFNEVQALDQIRNRYINAKEKLPNAQIQRLQKSGVFVEQCSILYASGYKDWIIVSAIYNVYLNMYLTRELGQLTKDTIDPATMRAAVAKFAQRKELNNLLPITMFVGEAFSGVLWAAEASALKIWGFEPRVSTLSIPAVQRFLRERMRFYELDLPHDRMFAEPSGDWPKLD